MSTGLVSIPLAAVKGDGLISSAQHLADIQQVGTQLNFLLQIPRSKAYDSASQTIPSGAGVTPLTFDTNVDLKMGVDPMHSTSTNPTRFTAPYTGIYMCLGQVSWNVGAGASSSIRVLVNGSQPNPPDVNFPGVASTPTNQVLSGPIFLNVKDYVEFGVSQSTGASIATFAGECWGSVWLLAWF
jgi:hypothetical protein